MGTQPIPDRRTLRLNDLQRDVRVCQIYEGTSDVQKIIIQRAL